MIIREITSADWPKILKIQSAVYTDVAPESLDVLQDKVNQSKGTCFVCEIGNDVVGYLLSHPWAGEQPPKLHKKLNLIKHCEFCFLHDLAIDPAYKGKGYGHELVKKFIESVSLNSYKSCRLVAIQGAEKFWIKHGFQSIKLMNPTDDYGESAVLMELLF